MAVEGSLSTANLNRQKCIIPWHMMVRFHIISSIFPVEISVTRLEEKHSRHPVILLDQCPPKRFNSLNAAQWESACERERERESVIVCVFYMGKGVGCSYIYSSSVDGCISDQLQWLSDWFPWTPFTSSHMSHRFENCLAQTLTAFWFNTMVTISQLSQWCSTKWAWRFRNHNKNGSIVMRKISSIETILSTYTCTGTPTQILTIQSLINLHSLKQTANRFEMDEDSRMEQKTWQVYSFGKRNVFRLHLNESRKGYCRRGRGR